MPYSLGKNVVLSHKDIIISENAKIGDGCTFHGQNCVGGNYKNYAKAPTIGKNVDIGVGAKIIGDIYIADNIVIGANAVVNKSFTEPGITIAGVPARRIK